MQPIFRSFRLKFHVLFPIPYALQCMSVKRWLKINSVVVDARALCYFHLVLLDVHHQPGKYCAYLPLTVAFLCPVVSLPSFLSPLLSQISVHFLNWHCVKQ